MKMTRKETKLTVRSYAEGNHSEREKNDVRERQHVIIHPVTVNGRDHVRVRSGYAALHAE
jgi:hypothetical protein